MNSLHRLKGLRRLLALSVVVLAGYLSVATSCVGPAPVVAQGSDTIRVFLDYEVKRFRITLTAADAVEGWLSKAETSRVLGVRFGYVEAAPPGVGRCPSGGPPYGVTDVQFTWDPSVQTEVSPDAGLPESPLLTERAFPPLPCDVPGAPCSLSGLLTVTRGDAEGCELVDLYAGVRATIDAPVSLDNPQGHTLTVELEHLDPDDPDFIEEEGG